MNIQVIKTNRVEAHDNIFEILESVLPVVIPEQSFVVISSKIIALCEGSVVQKSKVADKDELIIREAEAYLPRDMGHNLVIHTIKNNLVVPSAGIDTSNTGDYYVLFPKDSYQSAKEVYEWIQQKYGTQNFGVVITDSRSQILRNGVVGYALGFHGFNPIRNYRGTEDLFGRTMNFSQSNIPDALGAAATLVMGEGSESTPIAIISAVSNIEFGTQFGSELLEISQDEDIYFDTFFKQAPWIYKKTD